MEKRLLSVAELSEYLGLKKSTIYQWTAMKKIPVIKMGRLTKFDRHDIDRIIERAKVEPIA